MPKKIRLDLWKLLLLVCLFSSCCEAKGALKKVSLSSILELTPWVNCLTCFSMQAGKAFELHLPTGMIMQICSLARCVIIAREVLVERVSTSLLVKPSSSLPMASTEHLRSVRTSGDLIFEKDFPSKKTKSSHLLEQWGQDLRRQMVLEQDDGIQVVPVVAL